MSASPFDAPLIDPALLATDADLAVMRESVKFAREYVATSAFSDYVISEYGAFAEAQTDEEIDAFIRENGDTIDHPTGTAAIGKGRHGALDAHLRVKGTKGLRVVDASAFVSAHLDSTDQIADYVLVVVLVVALCAFGSYAGSGVHPRRTCSCASACRCMITELIGRYWILHQRFVSIVFVALVAILLVYIITAIHAVLPLRTYRSGRGFRTRYLDRLQ